MKSFSRGGVQFNYPSNWPLDTEETGDAWSVTVQSAETAFLLVSLRPDAAGPGELADETLAVLRGEYKELDAEPVVETVGGLPAVGHNIDFLSVDTSTLCFTRCINTADGPLLVMGQVSEYDRPRNEQVLRAMLASLTIADE